MGTEDWEYWEDSTDRGDDDLRVVRLCYKYALLRSRPAAALSSEELDEMHTLEELLLGDPLRARRAFRRIATLIPASIRGGGEEQRGLLLNLSPAGMYVALGSPLPCGTVVEVKLSCPDGDCYVFTGIVLRVKRDGDHPGVGLSLTRLPFVTGTYQNSDSSPSA